MDELKNRTFKIWAYTVSHSFLLLRSALMYPDQEGYYNEDCLYNIDIEFDAVEYIDIPSRLEGVVIRQLQNNIPEKLINYARGLGSIVFELESKDNLYYIIAARYSIGKNKWSSSQDRVFFNQLKHDEIIASSK
ncbi:hypothetical protein V1389_17185 [Flavobacterium rakeshii]|uniref:hypothetical protein n=1 Tax=Flavobacterium rakeshii TaxID=1038845 RepID=UPI002E7BE68E|nr:hypothetical protein [Flavobacterium rakeshii]MEE1900085.1 hypothetical protein [Flavobacterium rakeshii]